MKKILLLALIVCCSFAVNASITFTGCWGGHYFVIRGDMGSDGMFHPSSVQWASTPCDSWYIIASASDVTLDDGVDPNDPEWEASVVAEINKEYGE